MNINMKIIAVVILIVLVIVLIISTQVGRDIKNYYFPNKTSGSLKQQQTNIETANKQYKNVNPSFIFEYPILGGYLITTGSDYIHYAVTPSKYDGPTSTSIKWSIFKEKITTETFDSLEKNANGIRYALSRDEKVLSFTLEDGKTVVRFNVELYGGYFRKKLITDTIIKSFRETDVSNTNNQFSFEVIRNEHAVMDLDYLKIEFDYPIFEEWKTEIVKDKVVYKSTAWSLLKKPETVIGLTFVDYLVAPKWSNFNKFGVGYKLEYGTVLFDDRRGGGIEFSGTLNSAPGSLPPGVIIKTIADTAQINDTEK